MKRIPILATRCPACTSHLKWAEEAKGKDMRGKRFHGKIKKNAFHIKGSGVYGENVKKCIVANEH
jgi:hypothetical protein